VTTDIDPHAGTPADPANEETRPLALPFAWENSPGEQPAGERDVLFRFPAADDPVPGSRRLLGMSLVASALGVVGLVMTVRGVFLIAGGVSPLWYDLLFPVVALLAVALAVGAFLSIHRPRLPWALLLAAAVPLTVATGMTLLVG
jgi:hypothetical protein